MQPHRMASYLFFTLSLLLWHTHHAIEVIDDVWYDDFAYDNQGLNGWYIYYRTSSTTDKNYIVIPYVNGTLSKYHGVYQNSLVSIHYLKRRFQCKNDSSIKLGYKMAFCGNQESDKTQVHLNTSFEFLIDFLTINRLYLLNDDIISNYSCGSSQWYVYYDTANPQRLESFIPGKVSFDIKIEVKLSTASDIAAITDITMFCDRPIPTTAAPTSLPTTSIPTTVQPTSSPTNVPTTVEPTLSPMTSQPTSAPTMKSNIITDIWYDDFLYDITGLYGWKVFYVDYQNDVFSYDPDVNPLIYGDYTYHGLYDLPVQYRQTQLATSHILYRLFQCKNDSALMVKYSVVYCGNMMMDFINIELNGSSVSSIELTKSGTSFSDTAVINEAFTSCGYAWTYTDFVKPIGFISGSTQFALQFEYIISMDTDFGALYNISIVCDSSATRSPTTSEPTTNSPTTSYPSSNPTTSYPTTPNPTTSNPTTSNPTTSNPASFEPTSSMPTSAKPTSAQPTTLLPTTSIPTTFLPTTSIPTTWTPTTSKPTEVFPTKTSINYDSTASASTTSVTITSSTLSSSLSSSKEATTTTNRDAEIISETNTTMIYVPSSKSIDNASGTVDIMVIVISITAALCILIVISIIIYFKIYTKKRNKICEEEEQYLSNIQMNAANRKSVNKLDNNMSSSLNKLEVDDNSENSIEGFSVKQILSVSTNGETTTGDITIENNESDENDDSLNEMYVQRQVTKGRNDTDRYENNDDNDRSDSEKLYEKNKNITKGVGDIDDQDIDNNFKTIGITLNEVQQSNDNIIEGYIENKEDSKQFEDNLYLQSGIQTGDDV